MCRSFTSLVKFIPKYFILFDAIINGIVFLISFLHMYCLCIETQLIFVCVVLTVFLVESLGFSDTRSFHLQRQFNFFPSDLDTSYLFF